jgi:hypothetical protein
MNTDKKMRTANESMGVVICESGHLASVTPCLYQLFIGVYRCSSVAKDLFICLCIVCQSDSVASDGQW